MKKKTIIISGTFLSMLIMLNIYLSLNISSTNSFLFNTEALAYGEGGGSSGGRYQIIAGCGNASFGSWVNRCCKGSSINCTHQPCNRQIIDGCSSFGREDI